MNFSTEARDAAPTNSSYAEQHTPDNIELLPVRSPSNLRYEGDSRHSVPADPQGWSSNRRWKMGVIATTVVVVCLVIFLVIAAFRNDQYISPVSTNKGSAFSGVSKIAFGSCTAYDERDIEIFQTGIVPFQPDAWIWLGDMVYMDTAFIDCAESPGHPDCSCDASFLGGPPTQCFAGDLDHARDKVVRFVGSPSYQAFLGYMCPGHELLGSVVPGGTDPEQCLRPIVGTYDDHDSGWNNGNSRLPPLHGAGAPVAGHVQRRQPVSEDRRLPPGRALLPRAAPLQRPPPVLPRSPLWGV
uniref:Uncharacterized protein n=1 Tax=Tetraselmis sp. GSL018 TaxID=582737 RepID=A0A061RI92_9CHLO